MQTTGIVPYLQTGCAQPYVAMPVRLTPNYWDNSNQVINELTEWLSHNCTKIAGPLFYRYWIQGNLNTCISAEVGYPVDKEVYSDGQIISGHIPSGTFATLVHCANPATIHPSFETMQHWANAQSIEFKYGMRNSTNVLSGCFQFYLSPSANLADPNLCRTALAILTNL